MIVFRFTFKMTIVCPKAYITAIFNRKKKKKKKTEEFEGRAP